jgi:hypothetical protein
MKAVFQSCVESAWFQRLRPKHDALLESFEFNFNWRHFIMGLDVDDPTKFRYFVAGRCRYITK